MKHSEMARKLMLNRHNLSVLGLLPEPTPASFVNTRGVQEVTAPSALDSLPAQGSASSTNKRDREGTDPQSPGKKPSTMRKPLTLLNSM